MINEVQRISTFCQPHPFRWGSLFGSFSPSGLILRFTSGFLLFLMSCLAAQPVRAQSAEDLEPDISGYLKELGQISADNSFTTFRYENIIHHRIETEWVFSNHFELRADLRTRLLNGYSVNTTPDLDRFYENDPNFMDLSWVWAHGEHALLHSNIDRIHASYFNGPFELHAGRQRINWGHTFVWNPNDLFNAYAFLDFDYEERPGVDALLARYSWSYASSIELGYRLADSFEESVIGGMVRFSLGSYDVQAIAGHYLNSAALGVGWSGYLREAGFKGEITYFHPEDRFFKDTGHFTATAGVDYMLPGGMYLQGELLYNGGFDSRGTPLTELVQPPSADNLFIARSGYFLNSSYQLHPLVSGNIGLMGSFDRPIFIIIPQVSVSLAENLDFLVLAQTLKGPVFSETIETPNLFFFRLKWSY